MTPSVKKPKVFITHASRDAWVASQMQSRIQACGAATFLDKQDLQHGDDFEQRLLAELAACTEQLVLLTPWAMDRPYVWMEVGAFWQQNKPIFVLLYGISPQEFAADERVPVHLKKLITLQLNDGDVETYLGQLRRRVMGWEVHHG